MPQPERFGLSLLNTDGILVRLDPLGLHADFNIETKKKRRPQAQLEEAKRRGAKIAENSKNIKTKSGILWKVHSQTVVGLWYTVALCAKGFACVPVQQRRARSLQVHNRNNARDKQDVDCGQPNAHQST